MRDSNSRGLAPNTLSKSAGLCSPMAVGVVTLHCLCTMLRAERSRTLLNETRNETSGALVTEPLRGSQRRRTLASKGLLCLVGVRGSMDFSALRSQAI